VTPLVLLFTREVGRVAVPIDQIVSIGEAGDVTIIVSVTGKTFTTFDSVSSVADRINNLIERMK
jgi:hypothetical protein